MNRRHARKAGRLRATTAFVGVPEPLTIGSVGRGQQLIAGQFMYAGKLVQNPNISIWDVGSDDTDVTAELHGCTWLDDLAAVGTERAREKARRWIDDWINRFGTGHGPGWAPDVTGRRIVRWINHSGFLLRGQHQPLTAPFFQSLARQANFLSRRWHVAPAGLARFETLVGLIIAQVSLTAPDSDAAAATAALAKACETDIDTGGGIATRNPEELMNTLCLLNWAKLALENASRPVPRQIGDAIHRITPVLRALRHTDGYLARFHGGGRGPEGRLDEAIANSGNKDLPGNGPQMGYLRLSAGRCSLIVDAASPPRGDASIDAHASTLGFELTSGRRPLIVNSGSGKRFGPEWRRASRATPSHSTLGIEGVSSSELARGQTHLASVPSRVLCNKKRIAGGQRLELSHNGYQRSHGLTHARIIDLTNDGRSIVGEDLLAALDEEDQAVFAKAVDQPPLPGVPFALRFHLHPDVDAALDLAGMTLSLTLKSGEVWVLRHDGTAQMTLAPSVYLEIDRLKPRSTQQVVLTGRAMAYATRIRWSLSKAQNTPDVVRDFLDADLAEHEE